MPSTRQPSTTTSTVPSSSNGLAKGAQMASTRDDRCTPPMPVKITRSLLGYGVLAGPCYVIVVVAQAATRTGFDPARHPASVLANGPLGWIQITNFLLTGAMT